MVQDILNMYYAGYSINYIVHNVYRKLVNCYFVNQSLDLGITGKITLHKVRKAVISVIYDNLPVVDNQKYIS